MSVIYTFIAGTKVTTFTCMYNHYYISIYNNIVVFIYTLIIKNKFYL